MAEATLISKGTIKEGGTLKRYSFSMDNVAVGGVSDFIDLPLDVKRGSLHGIRVTCGSPNYNISIRQKRAISVPDVNEIYNMTYIVDFSFRVMGIDQPFVNSERTAVEKLYVVITNNDLGTATGTIYLDLFLYE